MKSRSWGVMAGMTNGLVTWVSYGLAPTKSSA